MQVSSQSGAARLVNGQLEEQFLPPGGPETIRHEFLGIGTGTEFADIVTQWSADVGAGAAPIWANGTVKARQRVNGLNAYNYSRSNSEAAVVEFIGVSGAEARNVSSNDGDFGWFDGGHGFEVNKQVRFSGTASGSGEGNAMFQILQTGQA